MANPVDNVTLNFTLNARAVEQAGSALQKELERGLGSVDFNVLRRGADKTFKQMGQDLRKALTQELKVDTKGLDKQLTSYQNRRLKIERQLAMEVGKGLQQGGSEQSKLSQNRLKAFRQLMAEERKLIQERTKSLNEMNKAAEKYLKTMKKAQKGGGGAAGGVVQSLMGGGKSGMPSLGGKGMAKDTKGVGKMTSVFKNLGKVMGGVGKGMGMAASALSAAATAIGAVVGVFGAIAAIVVGADSKMKELNKSFLQTTGAADLLGSSMGGVTDAIDSVRGAAIGAQFRLKSLAKDNIEILRTLNEHGHTMREMAGDTLSATEAMAAYGRSMELVLTYSRMIGESASTVAQNMATTSEELGMTLEGVAKKFGTISKFAMESGFSTKRFFSMVIQATSGMSMYNVRLEEASGLLVRIGKILGQKTGGEFLSSLSKGFVNESMQDRMKRVMLTGKGNTKEAMSMSAENTATSFQEKLMESGLKLDFKDLGINREGNLQSVGAKELTQILSKLSPEQQAKATAKISQVAASQGKDGVADGLRQQLQTLISISEGSKGGLTNMAKNLDALDMGGKLNMLRNSMKTMFPGKEIYELSTLQLAALESATGMSGEQLQQMRELTQGMDGNFKVLEDIKADSKRYRGMDKTQREAAQKSQIKAYGAYVNDQGKIIAASVDQDGNIQDAEYRDKNGKMQIKELKKLGEYYQSQGQRMDAAAAAQNFNEDRAISQEIANNTFSIADMLGSSITMILNGIYGVVRAILGSFSDNKYGSALKSEKAAMDSAMKAQKEQSGFDLEIRTKERDLAKEEDDGKRRQLQGEITALKIESEKAGMRAKDSMDLAKAVFNPDGSVASPKSLPQQEQGGAMSRVLGYGSKYGVTTYDNTGGKITTGVSAADAGASISGASGERLKKEAPTLYAEMVKQARLLDELPAQDKQKGEDIAVGVAKGLVDAVGAPSVSASTDVSLAASTDSVGGSGVAPINQGDAVRGSAINRTAVTNVPIIGNASPLSMHQAYGTGGYGFGGELGEGMSRYRVDAANPGETSEVGTKGKQSGKHGYVNTVGPSGEYDVVGSNVGDGSVRKTGYDRTLGTQNHLAGETAIQQQMIRQNLEEQTGLSNFQMMPSQTVRAATPLNLDAGMGEVSQSYDHKGTGKTILPQHAMHYDSVEDAQSTMRSMSQYFDDAAFTEADITRTHSGKTYSAPMGGSSGKAMHKAKFHKDGSENTSPSLLAKEVAQVDGRSSQYTSVRPVQSEDSIMAFMGEMKLLQKEKGSLGEKEDGSKYTIQDLEKDIVEAYNANGKKQMTLEQFKNWMKDNKPHFKNVEGNLKQVKKTKILTEDIKKILEKELGAEEKKKQIAQNLASYAGLSSSQAKRLEAGELPAETSQAFGRLKEMVGGDNPDQSVLTALQELGIQKSSLQDFIYTGGSQGGVIRPIHGQDSLLAMGKPGGPMENAMGRGGGGGTINVNVYSDVDVEKVKRAVYQAGRQLGIGGRGKTRAGQGNFGKKV